MDYDKKYRDMKDRVLPPSVKEHFEQSEKSMKKNMELLNNLKYPNHSSEGEQELLFMMKTLVSKIFSSIDSLSKENEALFVYHCMNQELVNVIFKKIEKQGIKIENIENDEGLEWLNNYFKHASEITDN